MMSCWKGFLALLVIASLVYSIDLPSGDITISVERVIDISTQVPLFNSISYFPEIYQPFNTTPHPVGGMNVCKIAYGSCLDL